MSKHLLLALPLASLLFVVGCCSDGTCYSSASSGTTYFAATEVVTDADLAEATEVVEKDDVALTVTEEEFEAMVAAAPAVKVVEKAPAPEVRQVEFSKEASTTKIVARIPAMPLPEGWAYIFESDLTDGKMNTLPIDEYYSHISSTEKNDI